MMDQSKLKAAFDQGVAAHQAGRVAEALDFYDEVLALQAEHAGALGLKGVALFQSGDRQEAMGLLRRAVKLAPENATHWINLGQALIGAGDLGEAIECYKTALRIDRNAPEALRNLADCLRMTGHPGEAVIVSRRAVKVAPDMVGGWNNLASSLIEVGDIVDGLQSFRKALQLETGNEGVRSNMLYALNYFPGVDAIKLCRVHRDWDRHHGISAPDSHGNDPDPERRLKIGYVSGDFRSHSVSYFLEPLLVHHDRQRFEIFAYAQVHHGDHVTDRFRDLVDNWCDIVPLDAAAAAQRIRDDGIDILIDLTGHTAGSRLGVFAHKPAPVQITWLGYPTTTGLSAIDYRITDDIVDPPGMTEAWGCETPLRLGGGVWCYGGPRADVEVGPLPAHKAGHITFGSFNHMPKINQRLIEVWARLLKSMPESRLMIKNRSLREAKVGERLRDRFVALGIEPDRLTLIGWTITKEDHFALYNEVDIGLDTWPYNGTTTTCEALWMGVPVITLCAPRHAGRVGASLLNRIGSEDLIADTEDGYIAIAQQLAGDLEGLSKRREGLRQRMLASDLCNQKGFAQQFEAALREVWQRWCVQVEG